MASAGDNAGDNQERLSLTEISEVMKFISTLDVEEVDLSVGDVRILVRRHAAGAAEPAREIPAAPVAPATVATAATAATQPAAPAPTAAPTPTAPAAPAVDDAAAWLERETAGEVVLVRSPMVGVFYRAKEPGADPFVAVGDTIAADDTVCLVEVMKLFHSISAGAAGRVEAILVEDGAVVENGQPLVVLGVN